MTIKLMYKNILTRQVLSLYRYTFVLNYRNMNKTSINKEKDNELYIFLKKVIKIRK